jgi:hypothetical protein
MESKMAPIANLEGLGNRAMADRLPPGWKLVPLADICQPAEEAGDIPGF